jgi:hypothetical protein
LPSSLRLQGVRHLLAKLRVGQLLDQGSKLSRSACARVSNC